jgi:hypothetical protein
MKDIDKIFRHARFRQAPGVDGVVPTPVSHTPAPTPAPAPAASSSAKKTVSAQPATAPTAAKATSSYSGGGGYSYGGGGGDSSPAPDPAAVAASIAAQMNSIAKKAYKRNKETIQTIYDTSKGTFDTNLANNNGQLEAQARYSRQLANADAEQAMREAYINQMLSRRDMGQWLASQGLTGGASETTRASLENAYQNARAQIDAERSRGVSDINMNYNNNIAQAIRQYNEQIAQLAQQKAQLEMQNENKYTSNQINALLTGLRYS